MSLLFIIQDATRRLGLPMPTAAYTSSDPQLIQLCQLAQQESNELIKRHDWERLTKEHTFTSSATPEQGGMVSDYSRMVPETFYNITQRRPVYGPISAQEWQFSQSVTATSAATESWRLRENTFLITPTPNGTDQYRYEYVSYAAWTENGNLHAYPQGDSYTFNLGDEELITLGVVWRFLRAKGFDYAEAYRSYELAVGIAITKDGGGRRRLNMSRRSDNRSRAPYVPDGSWPL